MLRESIDLRRNLSAGQLRQVRQFAQGNDMALRRIARTGRAFADELPRLYLALRSVGEHQWLRRRIREIDHAIEMQQIVLRRNAIELQTAASRKLAAIVRYRRRVKALAPKRG